MKRSFTALALVLTLGAAGPSVDPVLLHPAAATAKAPSHYDVSFKTTAGTFVVAVTRSWSPRGADRFYNLVKHGFFTGAAFFRVVPGFVIQFGLSPNSAVDAAWYGAKIKDDPVTQSNRAGYLSFASAGAEHAHDADLHQPRRQCTAGFDGIFALWEGRLGNGRGAQNLRGVR